MAKSKFDFKQIEEKWMEFWEKEKIYEFDRNDSENIFSIDIPPPTISGKLHMGHAFGDSQQDFFVRFKRMRGFNVLNPFGTDNNGLPTLRLVEKEKKVDSKSMNREEFIELCNKTISEEFIPSFLHDAKRLGISADWSLFYSTIDKHSRKISQKSFIDLYKDGREYRLDSPSLWCTQCKTTIAQVELEDKEMSSVFNDIVFKVGGKDLIVSTTRPELLSACVAIFVNEDDKRYKYLIGKKAKVPLFGFEVPIMTDKKAEIDKGTGVVMCCTFGDQTDMEWQKEYCLPIKMAISEVGKMTELAKEYSGLKVKDARKKIIEDLKATGLLKKQKEISHVVNVHERCATPIEFIKSKQWFIKYLDLKKEMLKWGKKINWYPEYMRVRYDNWVKGLKWDWCISRQIAFGIAFPVWYCKSCEEVILAREEDLPVDPLVDKVPIKKCPKCDCSEFIPEKDVMNTWATSAMTPTIVKELLKGTKAYEAIKDKPMDVRRNGHDIITFWDFNSVVKSQLHYGFNPWNDLMINGWILGKDGKKMSKSLGNGVAPQKVMTEFGADVLRYLSASSKLGEDLSFPEKELVAGKKFVNKILNASKFVFMNLEDWDGKKPKKLEKIDSLFLVKLNEIIKFSTESFEQYDFSKSKFLAENFFWKNFCDNYLEIVKKRVYSGEGEKKKSAQYVLYHSLFAIVKMMAPFTPFVSEEIYQEHFKKQEKVISVHKCAWPEEFKVKGDAKVYDLFIEVLGKIRQEKTKAQRAMNYECILTLEKDEGNLGELMQDLRDVMNIRETKHGKFNVEF